MSPPQLGRGDGVEIDGDSPVGDQGQIEFVLGTEEIDEEQVTQISKVSQRQAEKFQQLLHETSLQDKAHRSRMVPLQRGMRKETQAWKKLLQIMNEKGTEEVKAALAARDVPGLTSENIRQAVIFLQKALRCAIEGPATSPTPAAEQEKKPEWDHSTSAWGRFQYLKKTKTTAESLPKLRQAAMNSPGSLGWDHDHYFANNVSGKGPSSCTYQQIWGSSRILDDEGTTG